MKKKALRYQMPCSKLDFFETYKFLQTWLQTLKHLKNDISSHIVASNFEKAQKQFNVLISNFRENLYAEHEERMESAEKTELDVVVILCMEYVCKTLEQLKDKIEIEVKK